MPRGSDLKPIPIFEDNKLEVIKQGIIRFGGRPTDITLTPTYPVYKLIIRMTHNEGNYLYKIPPLSLIADLFDWATDGSELGVMPSNIRPWNGGGLYWEDGAGRSLHFRRSSIVSSKYITFIFTARFVGTSGSVTFPAPNSNISWKLVNAQYKGTGNYGGMGGGPTEGPKYHYDDYIFCDVEGNITDNSGIILNPIVLDGSPMTISIISMTLAYPTDIWKWEPNVSIGDLKLGAVV